MKIFHLLFFLQNRIVICTIQTVVFNIKTTPFDNNTKMINMHLKIQKNGKSNSRIRI